MSRDRVGVVRLPCSPQDFALAKAAELLGSAMEYEHVVLDVEGATTQGQYGVAFLQARAAVKVGIKLFLRKRGLVASSEEEVLWQQFQAEAPDACAEAQTLDTTNPDTPEEAEAYAMRCLTYVEHVLELKPPATIRAWTSEEEYLSWRRAALQLSTLLVHLGVESEWLPPVLRGEASKILEEEMD